MIDIAGIGILAAFLAGAISFLSPCVLPLVPGYVSYVAGQSIAGPNETSPVGRAAVVGLSTLFVLGFSTVFILLGAGVTFLGQFLLVYRYELNIVGGLIVIVFGMFLLGMTRSTFLQRDLRFHLAIPGGRPASAYVLGLAFGFGWTPCIGPILGAILTASATSATVSEGVALLAIYSAGLGVPFLIAACFTDHLAGKLRAIGSLGRRLHQGAGLVMIVMGIAIASGQLSAFSYWLLDAFPILGQIG